MKNDKLIINKTPFDSILLIVFFLFCVNFFFTSYFYSTFIEFIKFILCLSVFYLAIYSIKESGNILKTLKLIVGLSCILSIIGIIQYSVNPGARIPSLLINPNFLSAYLVSSFLISSNLFFYELYASNSSKNRFFYIISMILIALGIIIAQSRASIISLAAGVFLSSLLWYININKKKIIMSFTAILIIILILILFSPLSSRIMDINKDHLAYGRIEIYKSALRMIKDNPVFGTGFGTFEDNFHRYMFPIKDEITQYGRFSPFAHNEILDMASGCGIPGAFIFIAIIAVLFYCYYKIIKVNKLYKEFDIEHGYTTAVLSAVFSLFIHSLIDSILHLTAVAILLSLLIGIIITLYIKIYNTDRYYRIKSTGAIIPAIVLSFILILCSLSFFISEINYAQAKHKLNIIIKEKYLKNAVYFNPYSSIINNELGKIYRRYFDKNKDIKYYELSEKYFQKACSLNKSDGFLYRQLGLLYFMNKEHEKAVAVLLKASLLNPYSPFIYFDIGTIYSSMNDFVNAVKYFNKAAEIEPNYIAAHYNLGIISKIKNNKEITKNKYNLIKSIILRLKGKTEYSEYEKAVLDFDIDIIENNLK